MSDGTSGDDTDTNYRMVATTAISQVTEVRLYEETWPHIAQEHPEFAHQLPSLEHAILDTVANPTEVYRSRTDPASSYVFYSTNNLKGNRGMSVPVKVIADTTSGRITTAMFRGAVKGELLYKGGDND